MEKRTCRNQLIGTLPSTEPERVTVPREVEDLQSIYNPKIQKVSIFVISLILDIDTDERDRLNIRGVSVQDCC